ncbi:GIY-YIG nuclease family protein [Amycolatopsis taiwanensis]|uniref:GIY-YIG nuclease family protein n=1 Tax=Amycolatopsis taiwanensis TaxID=342230 RepID=UPI000482D640|nr:GIY-YIG nuclease family protein [Amycolatopsis taiwanensis]
MTERIPFEIPDDGEPLIEGLESHLYVVEFGEHGVKVGITANPKTRMAQHERDGRNFGRLVTRVWVSGPHAEAAANERAVIAYCRDLAGVSSSRRGEYFSVPYDDVQQYAVGLPKSRGDREAFEARVNAGFNVFKSIALGGHA